MIEVDSNDRYILIKKRYIKEKPYQDIMKLSIDEAELTYSLLGEKISEFYVKKWKEGTLF